MTRISILVVDDEPDFLKLIKRRLTKRNIDVETVGSGEAALEFLKTTPVDVVVLDVRMPGMNGIETLKEIRKRFRGIEVILLTGHGSLQSGVEGISQGAYDYILKPFSIDNLLERIRSAHEHAQLRRQRRERE